MNNSEKLSDKITSWLNEHGYPLEMLVAQAFIGTGIHTDQSVYFNDPETGEPREIDIVAGWEEGEFVDYLMFSIEYFVECKTSKHPWVLFVKPGRSYSSIFGQSWVCSKVGESVKEHLTWGPSMLNTLDRWDGNLAYGVTDAFRSADSRDAPYKALMSAAKAAHARSRWTDTRRWEPFDKRVLFASMSQPVIVLGGNLFEATLDESGKVTVGQVTEGVALFRYPFAGRANECTAVRILTLDALPRFVANAKQAIETITESKHALQKAYMKHIELRGDFA